MPEASNLHTFTNPLWSGSSTTSSPHLPVPRFKWYATISILAVLASAFTPSRVLAQDPSIFSALGGFVTGFSDVSLFFAPDGFVRGDALEERGNIQEVGVVARNAKANLIVGLDILTGFDLKQDGVDLRGSILALPTISAMHDESVYVRGLPPIFANIGIGGGLSQLQNTRTHLPDVSGSNRILDMKGNGYHLGFTYGLSAAIGPLNLFVDGSYRHTNFPSLDWREADKAVVPPVGWPTSIALETGTFRIGVGTTPPPP